MIIKIQYIYITNNKHNNYEHFYGKQFHTKFCFFVVFIHTMDLFLMWHQ